MGTAVGGGDLEVVIRHGGVVGPEVTKPDGNRPGTGRRDPVRAIEHADYAVCACGGGAVALLLGGADAAAADDAGAAAGAEVNTAGSDVHVLLCHVATSYEQVSQLNFPTCQTTDELATTSQARGGRGN